MSFQLFMSEINTYTQAKEVAGPREEDRLLQTTELYPWHKFRPSCLCGCFNFVLQLVFVACCGSFLFGFNIALLNTAIKAVDSDMKMCGDYSNMGRQLVIAQDAFPDRSTMDLCKQLNGCVEECGVYKNGELDHIKCTGGYTDLDCDSLKWFDACVSCAILIGGAVGSMTGGRFMGRGRRLILVVDMVIFSIGVISSVCANSFSAMMWARLIVGYAVGLASVACPTYMSEITPPEKRGKYGVFHQLLVTVGILIAMVIGLPLQNPKERDYLWEPPAFQRFWWRFMLGLGMLPALIGLYLLIAVYDFETPVWYVEQRRYKDAAEILERIYEKQDVQVELNTTIYNVRLGEESKKNGMTFGTALADPEYRWVIFVGVGLAGFQQFGGINVFMTSSSGLFDKAGLDGTMQTVMSIIMAVINVVMTFPTIVLIEKMGRKSLLLSGSAMQFVMVVPAAISYLTESTPDDPRRVTQILAIVAVLGFVTFFAVAFGPVVWVYLFEIYPMEIKDIAAAVATAFNWIAGIVMVFISIVVPNQVSFTLFAVLQLVGTLFVLFFMRETKGRTLGDSPFITKKQANPV